MISGRGGSCAAAARHTTCSTVTAAAASAAETRAWLRRRPRRLVQGQCWLQLHTVVRRWACTALHARLRMWQARGWRVGSERPAQTAAAAAAAVCLMSRRPVLRASHAPRLGPRRAISVGFSRSSASHPCATGGDSLCSDPLRSEDQTTLAGSRPVAAKQKTDRLNIN